MLLIALDK